MMAVWASVGRGLAAHVPLTLSQYLLGAEHVAAVQRQGRVVLGLVPSPNLQTGAAGAALHWLSLQTGVALSQNEEPQAQGKEVLVPVEHWPTVAESVHEFEEDTQYTFDSEHELEPQVHGRVLAVVPEVFAQFAVAVVAQELYAALH